MCVAVPSFYMSVMDLNSSPRPCATKHFTHKVTSLLPLLLLRCLYLSKLIISGSLYWLFLYCLVAFYFLYFVWMLDLNGFTFLDEGLWYQLNCTLQLQWLSQWNNKTGLSKRKSKPWKRTHVCINIIFRT